MNTPSRIAVHSDTGIQVWISWTLVLQSIAQTCTPTSSCLRLFTHSDHRSSLPQCLALCSMSMAVVLMHLGIKVELCGSSHR